MMNTPNNAQRQLAVTNNNIGLVIDTSNNFQPQPTTKN